jgi:hypothetical protein
MYVTQKLSQTALVALLGLPVCQGAAAATTELVASAESHSIEQFDLTGKWIRTFASTGPWVPRDLAVDGTGNVYVATSSGDILRFNRNGKPHEPMNFPIPIGTNTIESLIFDMVGNLYAPTHFGDFARSGYTVSIYKFTPAQLAAATPVGTILVNTTLVRANQMAFDKGGNLCVADFTGTVECYNSSSGATVSPPYTPEMGGAQPLGIGFDVHDRLIASSTFVDTVLREPAAHTGPLKILTSGLTPALEYLTLDSAGFIYVGSWHDSNSRATTCGNLYACIDSDFHTDVIYKIDPISGRAMPFINSHIWGPNRMVFYEY